jgi:uncharacterized protein YjeT (DUF2065 family)
MPADISAVLDTLLVIAGLVLIVTGLVMFIRSKTAASASSVEAFGIKLNVTHPSLILVLAGVGLMLAPRLLPESAGKPEPAVVATADKPEAAEPATTPSPAPAATISPTPAPTIPATAEQQSHPPAKSAFAPSAAQPSSAAPARPTLAPKTPASATATPKPTAERIASTSAVVKPSAATSTLVAAPPEVTASPSAAAKQVRPTLAYAALGLPIGRSFWSGETRDSYTSRMRNTLQQAGREVLHMDARGLDLGPGEFDAWWNESNQRPRSRELCAAPHAPHALLSARVETPTTISSVESAYWPELTLRLFVCASQRMYRQQKTLAPQNEDAWPFSVELNNEIERFLRTYRSDLLD